jgi:PhzF family phenazine biosynthesis protein
VNDFEIDPPEPVPFWQVDAFTDEPFAGNPAAVVILPGPRPDAWLQSVALEMNLSETAFLLECEGDWGLRWFTPEVEVDLCGHATLASAHVLWELGRVAEGEPITFHTRSGRLVCRNESDPPYWMDLPAVAVEPVDDDELVATLRSALGLPTDDGFFEVSRGKWDLLVEVDDESQVVGAKPDLAALAAVDARGIVVTALAASDGDIHFMGADFVSRFFGPRVGVPEDPVTGSAHCMLGPYWAERIDLTYVVGYQASRRGGLVHVMLQGDPSRVTLGGEAVTVARGELLIYPEESLGRRNG